MFVQPVVDRSFGSVGSRYFRYEVAGLQASSATKGLAYEVRPGGNVVIMVPFNRMNEEMQRITRLGGVIVSIQAAIALNASEPVSDSE